MTSKQKISQRIEESAFLNKCHSTRNRVNYAATLIRSMSMEARRQRLDLWPTLYNLVIMTPNGELLGKDMVKALRAHLANAQGDRCCYCRKLMPNTGHARPIEHVLNRSLWPQFSLFYWNLALACYDCNSLKGVKRWIDSPNHLRNYPADTGFCANYHPRYHSYDKHVKYSRIESNGINLSIYLGLTPQGRKLCIDLLYETARLDALKSNNQQIVDAIKVLQEFSQREDTASLQYLTKFIDSLITSILKTAGSLI
jgi:hypothetical protein